jgi:toxin ParE1/3/4
MRIVWLSLAQHDLASIVGYHQAAGNKDIAIQIVRRIVHSASAIIENPHLGRPSESVEGIHELHIPKLPYLLPYRVVADRIEILRVFHEAQDRPFNWDK